MPQLYGASATVPDASASVPDGPGVNDPVFRDLLNRVQLALEMVRGGDGAPETFEVVPGGSASSYSVKVGPLRIAPLVGTGGAQLVEATAETTLTQPTLAALTGVLDAWRYVVAYQTGAVLSWSLTSTAPEPHGWSSNRQNCYVGAIRTDGSGNPLAVIRTGRRYLYSRWYADAGVAISLGSAGTSAPSLATRVPPGAKTVRLSVTGVTGPGQAELTEATNTTAGEAVVAGTVIDLPLSASQEIGFRAVGGAAGCTVRVIGWEY